MMRQQKGASGCAGGTLHEKYYLRFAACRGGLGVDQNPHARIYLLAEIPQQLCSALFIVFGPVLWPGDYRACSAVSSSSRPAWSAVGAQGSGSSSWFSS